MPDLLIEAARWVMGPPRPVSIPLRRAVLCVACEAIYRLEEHACPGCGGSHSVAPARFLGSLEENEKGE